MFLITIHTKMAANRRCPNEIQNEEEGESFIEQFVKGYRHEYPSLPYSPFPRVIGTLKGFYYYPGTNFIIIPDNSVWNFVVSQTNCVLDFLIENTCHEDCQRGAPSNSTVKVSRAVQSNHLQRQAMVDVIVASIAIPLLVIFSLMLHNSMRRDWIHDFDARWRILGLGLSLLFISLIVCLYVTHRLGFCIWAVQQQREITRVAEHRRRLPVRDGLPAPLTSTGSQLHLMVNGELPPSYDSVMRNPIQPPPYFSVIICDEKAKSDRFIGHSQTIYDTRSGNVPDIHQSSAG